MNGTPPSGNYSPLPPPPPPPLGTIEKQQPTLQLPRSEQLNVIATHISNLNEHGKHTSDMMPAPLQRLIVDALLCEKKRDDSDTLIITHEDIHLLFNDLSKFFDEDDPSQQVLKDYQVQDPAMLLKNGFDDYFLENSTPVVIEMPSAPLSLIENCLLSVETGLLRRVEDFLPLRGVLNLAQTSRSFYKDLQSEEAWQRRMLPPNELIQEDSLRKRLIDNQPAPAANNATPTACEQFRHIYSKRGERHVSVDTIGHELLQQSTYGDALLMKKISEGALTFQEYDDNLRGINQCLNSHRCNAISLILNASGWLFCRLLDGTIDRERLLGIVEGNSYFLEDDHSKNLLKVFSNDDFRMWLEVHPEHVYEVFQLPPQVCLFLLIKSIRDRLDNKTLTFEQLKDINSNADIMGIFYDQPLEQFLECIKLHPNFYDYLHAALSKESIRALINDQTLDIQKITKPDALTWFAILEEDAWNWIEPRPAFLKRIGDFTAHHARALGTQSLQYLLDNNFLDVDDFLRLSEGGSSALSDAGVTEWLLKDDQHISMIKKIIGLSLDAGGALTDSWIRDGIDKGYFSLDDFGQANSFACFALTTPEIQEWLSQDDKHLSMISELIHLSKNALQALQQLPWIRDSVDKGYFSLSDLDGISEGVKYASHSIDVQEWLTQDEKHLSMITKVIKLSNNAGHALREQFTRDLIDKEWTTLEQLDLISDGVTSALFSPLVHNWLTNHPEHIELFFTLPSHAGYALGCESTIRWLESGHLSFSDYANCAEGATHLFGNELAEDWLSTQTPFSQDIFQLSASAGAAMADDWLIQKMEQGEVSFDAIAQLSALVAEALGQPHVREAIDAGTITLEEILSISDSASRLLCNEEVGFLLQDYYPEHTWKLIVLPDAVLDKLLSDLESPHRRRAGWNLLNNLIDFNSNNPSTSTSSSVENG